jgi:hypothetical protein
MRTPHLTLNSAFSIHFAPGAERPPMRTAVEIRPSPLGRPPADSRELKADSSKQLSEDYQIQARIRDHLDHLDHVPLAQTERRFYETFTSSLDHLPDHPDHLPLARPIRHFYQTTTDAAPTPVLLSAEPRVSGLEPSTRNRKHETRNCGLPPTPTIHCSRHIEPRSPQRAASSQHFLTTFYETAYRPSRLTLLIPPFFYGRRLPFGPRLDLMHSAGRCPWAASAKPGPEVPHAGRHYQT